MYEIDWCNSPWLCFIKILCKQRNKNQDNPNDGRKQGDFQRYGGGIPYFAQKIPKRQDNKTWVPQRQLHKRDHETSNVRVDQTLPIAAIRWPLKWLNRFKWGKDNINNLNHVHDQWVTWKTGQTFWVIRRKYGLIWWLLLNSLWENNIDNRVFWQT